MGSTKNLDEMSYRELQDLAKKLDVKATGKEEELKTRLKSNMDDGKSSVFGDMKDRIERDISGRSEIRSTMPRLSTGVPGLDEIVGGGFPEENLILVSGDPGSGKTTVGLQFLLEGIKNGETGVYVNMDEKKENIIRNAKVFGWDLQKYIDEENLHFVRPQIFDFKKAKRQIGQVTRRFDAERIVIDSLSVLGSTIESEARMRSAIMELNEKFSSIDATTMTISEVEGEESISRHGIEEYSADGIIRLYLSKQGGSFQRGVAVKKMRGSNHSKGLHAVDIGKEGLKIYPDQVVFQELS